MQPISAKRYASTSYVRRIYKPYIQSDRTIDGHFHFIRERTGETLRREALNREQERLLDTVESFSEAEAILSLVNAASQVLASGGWRPPV